MLLDGMVALITGAGRGIGFRIGCRLHDDGASVVFCDREATEMAWHYIKSTSAARRAIFHQADISQLRDIENTVNRTVQEFGRLDILVNNAGIDPMMPFRDVSEDTWHRVIDTNLKGTFFCALKAADKMYGTGRGRIINISSIHAQATMPGFSIYSTSKGGINSLTHQLALELASHGITVNAVAAGAIEVERFANDPLYNRDALAAEIPLGRVGRPEDISGLVAFLCSNDAGWITGQVITVDGGTLTRLHLYAGRPIPSGDNTRHEVMIRVKSVSTNKSSN